MIIGIDHGYGFIKTRHSVFQAGVANFGTLPPILTNVIEYEDAYYQVGCAPDGLAGDKTSTNDYYILSLAAIAEEMKAAGTTYGNVTLAVGAPLTRYGAEKDALVDYLSIKKSIEFKYEGILYKITDIPKIYTYPQGYAAILPYLSKIKGGCTLVEIGTATTEILPITSEHTPDLKHARTLQIGVANCISMVNEALSRTYQIELTSDEIIDIILEREIVMRKDVIECCRKSIMAWCDVVLGYLRQNKVNYDFAQTYFAGGGAGILQKYAANLDKDNGCITFIPDIKANVLGYEMLAKAEEQRRVEIRKAI